MSIGFPIRPLTIALIGGLGIAVAAMAHAASDGEVAKIVDQQIRAALPKTGPGGAAIVIRTDGRTLFFNYGMADPTRQITSDVLFNLGSVGKVFDTALLEIAEQQGELSLDDPVAKYVVELQQGVDVRRITLRQLATYTSGFVLPQDHPPWPEETFTLPEFIATLNAWTSDKDHAPGKQKIYSHAGFVLIHLVLERRFGLSFDELMTQRLLKPLGLRSTTLPTASANPKLIHAGRFQRPSRAAQYRAIRKTGRRSASPEICKAITTGWEPVRCTHPLATWPCSWRPILANFRVMRRSKRQCAARSKASFRLKRTCTRRLPGRCTRATNQSSTSTAG